MVFRRGLKNTCSLCAKSSTSQAQGIGDCPLPRSPWRRAYCPPWADSCPRCRVGSAAEVCLAPLHSPPRTPALGPLGRRVMVRSPSAGWGQSKGCAHSRAPTRLVKALSGLPGRWTSRSASPAFFLCLSQVH